jgi:hypothetical protein
MKICFIKEDRENAFNYDDIQVTNKGEVLKFGSGTIFHNEIFDIVMREWSKEYHKNWVEKVVLVSKEHYNIYIEGSQIYNLVINGPFIDSLKLSGGGETISGEICLN